MERQRATVHFAQPFGVVSYTATVMPASSIARDEAVVLVQQIMDGDYANDGEAARWLERLDRGFGCPSGYVSDLIFVHIAEEPTAAQVVDRAMAYRPIAL